MKRIYLKPLEETDVNEDYVNWLNDKAVNKYMECRFTEWTEESVKEYVRSATKLSGGRMLFGIFTFTDKLIGTAAISSIDYNNKFAYVGLMIGDRGCWRKGYGTETLALVKDYAFNKLELHKLMAGVYEDNYASRQLFLKSGFVPSGYLVENRFLDGKYVGEILYEIIKDEKVIAIN